MQELKDRIVKEGKILPGNIVKVDGFLNHRVDCAFMGRIADEFKKYFDLDNVDLILTAEASGIALSAICAYRYGKPMVYAKKAKSDNIEGGLYQSEIFSYTYKKKVTLLVSKEWLHPGDRVLVIDDFLAKLPENCEVVLTGRKAPKELLDRADYITEFRAERHPFEKGVQAREGIEY